MKIVYCIYKIKIKIKKGIFSGIVYCIYKIKFRIKLNENCLLYL